MKDIKIIIIVFLVGVSVFSISNYIAIIREKQALMMNLENEKIQLVSLENQKQNLLQALEKEKKLNEEAAKKNLLLKENLAAAGERIKKLFVNNKAIEELNSQISVLKAENAAIRQDEDKLKLDLDQIRKEKEQLDSRLTSIPELKKALKEVKKQRRTQRQHNPPAQNSPGIEANAVVLPGNKGFIIKDGVFFSAAKVKIEVNPAAKN